MDVGEEAFSRADGPANNARNLAEPAEASSSVRLATALGPWISRR
jgi:hypothetical protein